jgi:hypothetical protein
VPVVKHSPLHGWAVIDTNLRIWHPEGGMRVQVCACK